jgi:glycosyltransferase involved in cell wall biosynthesis
MRILFVLHYPPPVHGAAVMGGHIKESKIINSTFECRYINIGTSTNIKEIGNSALRKLGRYLALIWQVKKQVITFKPDICYFTPTSHGIGFYKDALLISCVKLVGVKTIYHFHNKGIRNKQDRFFDNFLYRFIFRNAHVILLSKYLYSDIQKYVDHNMVHYCPNGVPDMKKERRITIRNDKPELLFLSNLILSKGVMNLIEACEILKDRGLEFHCTISGGDMELKREEVESAVNIKALTPFVLVAGSNHSEDKNRMMRSADIFVHPTYNDCMPLVILEAMQESLPIVSTFEGAIPDLVDDNKTGFLVPLKDPVALADRLEVLIRDSEMRINMGRAGREKYEQFFSLERFEKRMVDILQNVGNTMK